MSVAFTARIVVLALGTLGLLGSPHSRAEGGDGPALLYFFTTPEAEGGPLGARRAIQFIRKHPGQIKLRPVLLAGDFSVLRTVTEQSLLYRTVKELEADGKPGSLDIPLYDEEGLRLAERWEVKRVPAFVLVKGNRGHSTAGASATLEELWDCVK